MNDKRGAALLLQRAAAKNFVFEKKMSEMSESLITKPLISHPDNEVEATPTYQR